ncbi:4'-phosphopantetheinyl transferase family protein [Flavobacterium muglaense]|uniref:4'-phosphopantetheinyl transferase superfamily protein n=1 Tax=Flavobacterium muglaense TaxID=2764716 RepID=A0A923SFD5_9FLAO|nr:4'-phosphopantetheinyl transferase superfamily protein [Flavobacterium muglaense]MBC5837957.1 4'-phosphopantetheinyl transferase superfamily protein [Flavobacterium muglaense]MBC5844481.1 4'-phosphopantetheinyl transferase superfamily protein [Flavobacterium muglaense]
MPLYKTINVKRPEGKTTTVLVWEITESFDELRSEVVLNMKNRTRLEGMKSELHQRGFLSVRKLMQEAGYNDLDLFYDEFGKPHLKDDKYISITHSHHFSAIIISDESVGIDIELQREKIIRIADKFVDTEFKYLDKKNEQEYIKKLTVIWGAKEAIFKIRNEKGISFNDHIRVKSFRLQDKKVAATLHFEGKLHSFELYQEEIKGFGLVYAFQAD